VVEHSILLQYALQIGRGHVLQIVPVQVLAVDLLTEIRPQADVGLIAVHSEHGFNGRSGSLWDVHEDRAMDM
jgi:hypothetical protein